MAEHTRHATISSTGTPWPEKPAMTYATTLDDDFG
jgi:hypothetical protein